jgi:hypothetical protein
MGAEAFYFDGFLLLVLSGLQILYFLNEFTAKLSDRPVVGRNKSLVVGLCQ